jgi:hypothetical protein
MATSTETRRIQIIADGSSVNASMEQMTKATRLMWQELSKLEPGSDAFVKKSQEFQDVKKRLDDTKQAAKGAEKSLNDLANEALAMSPFGGIINGINGAFLKTKSVLATVSASFHTLKGAIVATGFGALVVVLGLVVNYFTSTQEGIDKVNRVLEPMKVLLQRVIGVLQELGAYLSGAFSDAINNPRKAFQSFIDFIQTNFMNRIKSIGVAFEGIQKILNRDFAGGFKMLGDSIIQATTGVTEGTNKMNDALKKTSGFVSGSIAQGKQLADMNIKVEKSEIELVNTRSNLNNKYQESLEIAKDQTKSEAERLAAARVAAKAENDLLDAEQNFMDLKIDRLKLEQTFNDTSREGYLELANLEAQRTDFETQASKRRTKAKSLENTIAKEIDNDAMKRSDERRKKEEENDKRLAALRQEYLKASLDVENTIEDLKIKLMEEGSAKKLAQLDLDTNRELEKLEERRIKLLKNETLSNEEREALNDQFAKIAESKRQERKEAQEKILEEEKEQEIEKKLEAFDQDQEREILLLENAALQAIDAETSKQEALLAIQRHYASEKLALLQASGEGESLEALKLKNYILAIDKEIADGKISNEERVKEAKRILLDNQFETAKGFLSLGIDLMEKDSAARKAFVTAFKGIQAAQVIMDGVREIQAIRRNAAANPMNALIPGYGIAIANVQSVLAGVKTAIAVNKIRTTKYATGGVTGGGSMIDMSMDASGTWRMPDGVGTRNVGSFASGGHVGSASFGVIGERGAEWVGPNWMMRSPKYANIFGYLEAERRKATPFAVGGSTAPTPAVPSSGGTGADVQNLMAMMEQFGDLSMKLDQMVMAIQEWPTRLRVVNDPRDILDGVRVLNEIEADSRINR